jgi:HEAT repeat protein
MRAGDTITVMFLGWLVLGTPCPSLAAAGQSFRNEAWSILSAGLQDKSVEKRVEAIAALGVAAGDARALTTLEQCLQDPKPEIRTAAVAALGDMNAKSSLPKIKALLSYSDAKTTLVIAAVLKKFGDPEGLEIYNELVTGERKDGQKLTDGIKDRKGLEKLGAETAIGFLPFGGAATGTYGYMSHSSNSAANVYVIAVNALAEDPDLQVRKALVQAAFDGKVPVRVAALRALAKRGDPTVVNDIEPAMHSNKAVVSYTAAAAILHLLAARQTPVE